MNVLKKIAIKFGKKGLNLSHGDPCGLQTLKMMQEGDVADVGSNPDEINNTIRCNCSFNNGKICHITDM